VKAAVLTAVGQPLVVEEIEIPTPGQGDVLIGVRASGVCHTDVSQCRGAIPVGPLPTIVGHEAAGVVEAVGPGVEGLDVGDHVVFSWIAPCRRCPRCLGGQPYLCVDDVAMRAKRTQHHELPSRLSINRGGYAEYMVARASQATRVDRDMPFEQAALLGCSVMTGVGAALNTAQVRAGSSVVVIGCGGVGLNVIQGARIAGASTIVAVDINRAKGEIATRLGATAFVDPAELDVCARSVPDGPGFDYAFEAVGRASLVRAAYDATRHGGMTVSIGAGRSDDHVAISTAELFRTERRLVGSFYGSSDPMRDLPRLVRLWRAGHLHLSDLISDRISLDQINSAHARLVAGTTIRSVVHFAGAAGD
jgi:S-(hydroxymethyl)glutathione dehydrogenase/alcohol dehydrogenase